VLEDIAELEERAESVKDEEEENNICYDSFFFQF
jgi:hypothetical protein